MSQTNPRRGAGELTPSLPSDPEVLRAWLRKADRHVTAMRPVLEGARALLGISSRPDEPDRAAAAHRQLEALRPKLLDLQGRGLDLLRDILRPSSLHALGEVHESVHRQAVIDAGTNDVESKKYNTYFIINMMAQTIASVRLIRGQIIARLEGHHTQDEGRIIIDESRFIIAIDGVAYHAKGILVLRAYRKIVDANGVRITGENLKCGRVDRELKTLPDAVKDTYDKKPGNSGGYGLKAEFCRPAKKIRDQP